MSDLEIWVVVLGVLVVAGNAWIYWRKWHRREKKHKL